MNQLLHVCCRAALSVLALCLGTLAWADDYPSRPIRLIVGFSPGGAADSVGRALAEGLSARLGQPVVVENRAGANGNLAADLTAKAAPDGYTLYFPSVGHAVNASLYKKLGHDPVRDFTPIGKVFAAPNLLVVPIKSPHKSVADLMAFARANPGKLSFASSGAGTSVHLSAELFMHLTRVEMVHIPYKGTGSAMPDLISGVVDLSFPNLPSALPLVKSGQLRALGVTTDKRSSAAPQIPSIAEAGVHGYDMSTWYGLVGPARLPPEITQRLNRELQAVLQLPSFRERLLVQGAEPTPGTAEEFGRFLVSEIERWRVLIRQAGVTLD
ncbi:MAG: tripartite tricarboxylate transporter substrate binding protein [Limnohabitans sp.]|jgi:tripartite-type tricarboxylate transporter receptor subunit TctC|nr:tripartite tricarboxylate transporter substrate binding protein [Limnohabitans sp.]